SEPHLYHLSGSGFFVVVDQDGFETAVEPGEIFAWLSGRGHGLRHYGLRSTACGGGWRGIGVPWLVVYDLSAAYAGRTLSEPSGAERDDEAGAAADRRPDHGRLVLGCSDRQLHGRRDRRAI